MSERTKARPGEKAAPSPRLLLVVMCVGYFLVLLDVTIVNVALPQIGSSLGAGVSGLQWVVDGYAIALAGLMLGAGTVGDLHGHKRIVLCGLALFGLASLGCGLAPGIEVLVGFRVLQGAGAALLLPGTLAVITHAFPEPTERARAIGLWAGIGSAALAAGPLLGGALVQGVGWRAVFFINVPIVIVAFAVAVRVMRESTGEQGRRLDVPGVLLAAALLAATTFAFIQGGHGGAGTAVLAAVVFAVCLVGAFVAVERRAPDPMLPLALLRRADFCSANAIAATMNLATLRLFFVLTIYLQRVQGRSPLAAGSRCCRCSRRSASWRRWPVGWSPESAPGCRWRSVCSPPAPAWACSFACRRTRATRPCSRRRCSGGLGSAS